MELIYVWIEKYRNIEQCGFHLSREFIVEVKDEENKNNEYKGKIKRININKHLKHINIYGKNITNVTAIVGRNSVGKSNFLSCIGELLTSFNESSFILIYYDIVKDNYILECNQIAIKDDLGNIECADQQIVQPKTLILKFNNGEITKDSEMLYDTEYITIKETLDEMMYPNANSIYSYISRFGLSYKKLGLLYQFLYLKDSKNNIENFKNNDIWMNFKIVDEMLRWNNYKIKILPKHYMIEKFHCGNESDKETYSYKKLFMLRLLEKILNEMSYLDDNCVQEPLQKLEIEIIQCKGDIDKLFQKYEVIKKYIIQIRSILMEEGLQNTVNLNICYYKFIELLEKIIYKTEEQNFMNSYEFKICITTILNDKDLSEYVYDFLKLADSEDVCLEFINSKMKIYYSNLSDGLKERFNLFSTIHKCVKQNNTDKYKNIILILDEPDAHMHPEWSRGLFDDILHFLKKIFDKLNFQIIFTTHSPFMLSDIPKEDVIYLSKDNNGNLHIKDNDINTFGCNIHMLFKHSFFIDSTTGEFANKKIKGVVRDLSEKTKEEILSINGRNEEIKYIIDNIGEPVIKRKLEEMYREIFYKTIEDYRLQVQKLQKEKVELETKLKDNDLKDIDSVMKLLDERISELKKKAGDGV